MKTPKHATTNYKALKPFLNELNNDPYLHFENGGYEPLVLEFLGYSDYKGRLVYSIAHYYEQNGDLMCDPEITFAVDLDAGEIWPITYQMDAFGMYQQVFKRQTDGNMTYSPRLLREIDEFLWQWLKNIKDQGWYEVLADYVAVQKGDKAV